MQCILSAACCAAAGWNAGVAEAFLDSVTGRRARDLWDQAQSEDTIQQCLSSIICALLTLLHGREQGDGRSRPTYYDTHGRAPDFD